MKNLQFYSLVLFNFYLLGCAHSNSDNTSSDISNPDIPEKTSVKSDIENYIEANWQAYGYKEKPDKFIALTFDDGPCPPHFYGGSAALLRALALHKVKATFFVVGENAVEFSNETRAMSDAGHELGNHSYGHQNLGTLTPNAVSQNLQVTSQRIKEITGEYPKLMRPPYISYGSSVINTCKDFGMAIIVGSIDARDWDRKNTPDMIKDNVLSKAHDGGIVIMHDTYAAQDRTILAIPGIITGLRERGYWFLTVSELAALKGVTPEPGSVYNFL